MQNPPISHRNRRVRRLVAAVGVFATLALLAWALAGRLTEQIDSYVQCAAAGNPITQTDPPTCRDGNLLFIGPASVPADPADVVQTKPFEILVDGDTGGVYPNKQEVITSAQDWSAYWHRVHASQSTLPPLIPVDFSKSQVFALSEGPKTTDGYVLKVTSVVVNASGTRVNVSQYTPGITCKVKNVRSNRYFVVKTDILPQPVSFNITSQVRVCS